MKYILFDRDGTLIKDPTDERVTSINKIRLFPDTLSSLKRLHEAGYAIIMITNQAGIAEGRITESEFDEINDHVVRMLEQSGVEVATTYMCPHVDEDECFCRKPEPKLLLQAIEDFEITETYMVGDHRTDIQAGMAAGATTILVHTANMPDEAPEADYEVNNLTEAVDIILGS